MPLLTPLLYSLLFLQPQTGVPAVTAKENVTYRSVNGSELHLDIYQPALRDGQLAPAVILIHGGGWRSLDKSTMSKMANYLAGAGFVAFSVDYRLLQGEKNRWPAQLDDVQFVVRWVRANAAAYHVDPQRIGAFGHSAGAQLAALLGMQDTRDNSDPALARYSSKVQAVVDASGPVDFTVERNPQGLAFLTDFLGASYTAHPEVWREASPAFHAAKDNAPFLIIHGTEDQEVPISQAEELLQKLQSAGVPVSLLKVDDGHTFRTPEARRELAGASRLFFTRYLVDKH